MMGRGSIVRVTAPLLLAVHLCATTTGTASAAKDPQVNVRCETTAGNFTIHMLPKASPIGCARVHCHAIAIVAPGASIPGSQNSQLHVPTAIRTPARGFIARNCSAPTRPCMRNLFPDVRILCTVHRTPPAHCQV